MSVRNFSITRQSSGSSPLVFSSRSLDSYRAAGTRFKQPVGDTLMGVPIMAVSVNQALLTPLDVYLDPRIQAVRLQEKEQIKTLNNRFVSFIDKVRLLEQQNKLLETKWKMLESATKPPFKTEATLQAYIRDLQGQLDETEKDRDHLHTELLRVHAAVQDAKQKYEDEINKRNATENEFVLLKKKVDAVYLDKADMEKKRANLNAEVKLMKILYEEELSEMQEELKDISVVVQMNNSRALDMDQAVADVRRQYDNIASRSRQEAEVWYKCKVAQISSEAAKFGEDLRSSKSELAELKRTVTNLQSQVSITKRKCASLQKEISCAESRGEDTGSDAHIRVRALEAALHRAKQDMAKQLCEYHDLMNVKLALDIEIATYRQLLEGEEERIGQ
ncbi:keratin, type II cytoskeletal 8-like [Denticeps clupeoides]|uniref:IF rod domain-containing protein n=1 Tax=Denticeps clupeoides TaxID=299321 RepID=A0AAY4BCF4_9TELE|nr:keratin, type II cytoskeletal 8-like [Denticeps clupeoides]